MVDGLQIWLLGSFRVELNGQPVADDAWRRNRARALVKILALTPTHRLHREQLMDALWPELDPGAAAANLRKAIHFARKALASEHLRVRGEDVSLAGSPLSIDVDAFESAVMAGDLSAAIALYHGDLLPEDRFEPWAEQPRERLRSMLHRLLLQGSAEAEKRGDLDEAARMLTRLVTSDPLHEEAVLALMRVHASSGARHLAVRQFRVLESRLREDLGVEPGESIRRLYQDILAGTHLSTTGSQAPSLPIRAAPPSPPFEERKLVTVLSAEAVARASDPELARRQIGAWADRVRLIIADRDGTAEFRAGGSIVAIFGVPKVHEDDAVRALRAALEIVERASLPTHIGIATGEVIARVDPEAGPRTAAGVVMIEADRLREAAAIGTVRVADRSVRATGTAFRFADEMTVDVGLDRLVAWRLVGEERVPRPSPGPESALIGRDAELAALLSLFDETVQAGRPRLVMLVGAAGVGKSRLVREAVVRLNLKHLDARILSARCLSGGQGSGYQALGEILRDACGISLGDSAADARAKVRRGVADLMGDLDATDLEATTFALAATAGINLPDDPLAALQPQDVAERMGLAWPRFTSACAAGAPTLVVLEDIHWASPELLAMTERIVLRSKGPLLVLATARPELREAHPDFGARNEDDSTIAVRPLGDLDSRALLRSLLPDEAVDAGLREDLLTRADGNPFYLEQLTMHVRDERDVDLPDTLHSLLAARLDSLGLAERRVLQEAAVMGRVFWEAPLQRAMGDEPLDARISGLERAGFILRSPSSSLRGQAEFTFRHVLLHDVAYASLPRERRAQAHAAVGAWLEEIVGERVDEVVDLLAHHYAAAIDPGSIDLAWDDTMARESSRRKAVGYLLRAGDAARRRFATDRAIEAHGLCLECSIGPDERLRALEALAEDHESTYHGDAAARFYGEALKIARTGLSFRADQARLSRKLGWMMAWNPGGFAASPDPIVVEALVAEGLSVVEDGAERAWLMLVDGVAARLYRGSEPFGQGKNRDPRPIAERIASVEEARTAGAELGRHDLAAAAEQALGLLLGLAGRYADMLLLARAEVSALRPQDSRLDRADALRKLAVHLINIDADFAQGLHLGQRSRELVQEGSPHQVMHACWPVLVALFQLARWDELLLVLNEHMSAFRIEPAVECQFVRDGPAVGAAALTVLGHGADGAELASLLGDPLRDRHSASAWQSRYATLRGDPATARTISADKALEGRAYGPQHAFALLEALAALKDWDAALAVLPQARRAVVGNALLGPMIDRVEGQARIARGERETGISLLDRAIAGFQRLNASYEEARAIEARSVD